MNYLFAAYTIIWIVLFAYIFSIARRQEKIRETVDRVRQILQTQKKGA
jgi:CcmD family protein